jgi:hypothetical protein
MKSHRMMPSDGTSRIRQMSIIPVNTSIAVNAL